MALINGALQIGRSGIMTAQAALSVAGNNMANAATPGFSRQRASLSPTQFSEVIPGKFTGTGVRITNIGRLVDDALNGRIRTAVGESASYLVEQQVLIRAEATFNELTNQDLSSRMNKFFTAFSNLQTEPSNTTTRSNVIIEGESLSSFIRQIRSELYSIQQDLDAQVRFQVAEADALAAQVASLNKQVVSSEAGRAGSSSALRDQRDVLLKELGELVSITTREVEGGAINVFIGSDPLIQYSDSRGISFIEEADINGVVQARVAFSDNKQTLDTTSGKIHGLLQARDNRLGTLLSDMDSWTQSLILEVNQHHSLGQSQQGYAAITSFFAVDDPAAALPDAAASGLPWAVNNGVFNLHIYDSDGKVVRSEQIKVDAGQGAADTSLNALVAQINAQAPEVIASVDTSNRLHIQTASSAFTFGFSGPTNSADATNVLAVLGVNTYFQGSSGVDITVRQGLDEAHVVAGADGQPTNGGIAGQIAQLSSSGVDSLNGLSLTGHFTAMIGRLATDSKAAQDNYVASDIVVQTLENERQSVSGVSLDEEAVNLMVFQRVLQGSSRYIGIIDQMMDEILSLV